MRSSPFRATGELGLTGWLFILPDLHHNIRLSGSWLTTPALACDRMVTIHLSVLVDPEGFEPSTSSMPLRRAPNCAMGPTHGKNRRAFGVC